MRTLVIHLIPMDAVVAKRQFLEYIEIERGRAVKTIENYDHYLSRYFEQMEITTTCPAKFTFLVQ